MIWRYFSWGRKVQSELDTELKEIQAAATLVLALMSSVPQGTISPIRWWERAKSALSSASERTYDWPAMVSAMCDSLGISSLQKRSASAIYSLASDWSEAEAFERLRARCERDAVYVVAIARMRRDEQKKKQSKTGVKAGFAEGWTEDQYDRALAEWDETIEGDVF